MFGRGLWWLSLNPDMVLISLLASDFVFYSFPSLTGGFIACRQTPNVTHQWFAAIVSPLSLPWSVFLLQAICVINSNQT